MLIFRSQIDYSFFFEPQLLQACKQIRKEAGSIFYSEQILQPKLIRWVVKPLLVFNRKYNSVLNEFGIKIRYEAMTDNTPNWQNLLYALGLHHQGRIEWTTNDGQPSVISQRVIEEEPLDGIFRMVGGLRGLPWLQVIPLLETSRQLLILIDERWRREE